MQCTDDDFARQEYMMSTYYEVHRLLQCLRYRIKDDYKTGYVNNMTVILQLFSEGFLYGVTGVRINMENKEQHSRKSTGIRLKICTMLRDNFF